MLKIKITETIKIPLTLLLIAVIAYILKYLFNLLLANTLPPALYGDTILSIKLLAVAANLLLLGTGSSAKRFLPQYLFADQPHYLNKYIKWNLTFIFKSIIIYMLMLTLLAAIIFLLHLFNIKDFQSYHLTICLLILAPLLAVLILLASFLNCNQNYLSAQTINSPLRYLILIMLFSAGFLLFFDTINYIHIFTIFFICFALLLFIELATVFSNNPKFKVAIQLRTKRKKIEDNVEKEWRHVALNLATTNIIFLLVCCIDLLLVEIITPKEASVGHYSAILIITGALWMTPRSSLNFIKPQISELLTSDKKKKILQNMINSVTRLIFGVNLLIFIIIVSFHTQLLHHFGKQYIVATKSLIILSTSIFISFSKAPAGIVLAYSGNERTLVYMSSCELIALIVFGAIATYYYGIIGTATMTGVVTITAAIASAFIAQKRTGIRTYLF